MVKESPIISFLLEENIIGLQAIEQLISRCQETGKSLVSMLKSEDLVTSDQLTRLIALDNSIEFVQLTPDMIDQMAIGLISAETARQYNLIPVRIEKDKLLIAMSSPLNLSVRDAITTKTGYKVVPLAATQEAVSQAIAFHFNLEAVTKQDIVEMRLKQSSSNEIKVSKSRSSKVKDDPIVRLVDSIISGGINARASDIHIEPQEPDMRVRYRVDGILIESLAIPASVQLEVVSHIKILADMDISEKRLPQDGHVAFMHAEKDYDLRISSLPATTGEKIVIRILDTTSAMSRLRNIVSSQQEHDKFKSLIANPYGIILLTGPTGSGKTTTLYSLLQELNTPDKNIVTVEDPVEYRLNGITQVQIKPEIDLTFATCLKTILRQDPDIILIGEIRDYETAEIAISAALTGHLVLSTLHTNDAVGAVSRLVNLGIPPFQVASALLGTVAQRLVRTACPKCEKPYTPSQNELNMLKGSVSDLQAVTLYKGDGCEFCRNTGYSGRQGVYEILDISQTIREMIVDGSSNDRIKAQAIAEGMKTLRTQGLSQVLTGRTTLDELLRVIDMREE